MSSTISTTGPLFGGTPSPTLQMMWNTIRTRVPGVTDEQMQQEFVLGASKFFSESLVWQNDGFINVVAPVAVVGLQNWLEGTEVVFPLKISYNGVWLAPVAEISDLIAAQVSTPQVFTFNPLKNITLAPQPNSISGVLHIYVALRPKLTAPMIPEQYISQWFDGLLSSALTRLYMQPSMPWSNKALGDIHAKESRAWINKARDAAKRGFARGASPWSFPYFSKGSGASMYGWGGNAIWGGG